MNESATYCVLLELIDPVPVTAIAKVMSEMSGIPVFDATRHITKCRGFLLENCTKNDSMNLVEKLKTVNIGARIFNQNEIVQLPEIKEIKKALIEPEGLSYFSGNDENKITTEWNHVALLSTGILNEKIVSYHKEFKGPSTGEKTARLGLMAAGIPVGFGKKKEVTVKKEEANLCFYLDIFLSHPTARIRINPDSFNFDCLKEKKSFSSTTNFRLLVSGLSEHSVTAFKNQGTEFILSVKPLNQIHYDSHSDLEKESRWILSINGYEKSSPNLE